MVVHFICLLFSAFVVYTVQPGTSLFSWHPALMCLAYMLFLAESILMFSPESSLLRGSERQRKVRWHWILMTVAAVFALAGLGAIWYNKERNGSQHMTSVHGKLGYVVVLYTVTQCCAGSLLLYPKFSASLVKLSQLKLLHATSGCMLFLMACVTLVSGMNSTYFLTAVTGTSWYACLACPVMLLAVVVNQVAARVLSSSTSQK